MSGIRLVEFIVLLFPLINHEGKVFSIDRIGLKEEKLPVTGNSIMEVVMRIHSCCFDERTRFHRVSKAWALRRCFHSVKLDDDRSKHDCTFYI